MQPITPTLLQAAQSSSREPVVQAIIEDRRVRWATLHDWPAGPDIGRVGQFNNGSITLRAVSDDAGQIWTVRVWVHSDPAAWEAWTLAATDAQDACDVAVAWMAPYTWLLLYESASDHQVMARISTDDGVSWSGAHILHTAAQAPWLAAWGEWAFILEDRLHAYQWTGATWEGPHTLWSVTTPEPHGVAAYNDSGAQWGHLLYSSCGQLFKVEVDSSGATPSYTTPRPLTPGGDQGGSDVAAIVLPSLTRVLDLGIVATWVEQHTGPLDGWGLPVSAVARDANAQHFGQICPLAEAHVSAQRWHLAYNGVTKMLYAGHRRRIVRAPLFDRHLREWMRLGPVDVLSARRVAERHEPGSLTVELLDPAMVYRNPGHADSAASAIKPVSAVRLRRGYRTAAGIETIDSPNYYVTTATLSEGQGAGRLHIEALDAFGLLALWQPVESIQWYDRTIAWLLAEICGRVGLRVETGDAPGTGATLPHFGLHPHQSALTAVRALLRLGCAVARPAPDDTLHLSGYPLSQGSPLEIGAEGEVHEAAYGWGRHPYTHIRVASEAHDTYTEAEAVEASQAMGQRFSRMLEDNRVATEEMATNMAAHMLALAASWGRRDQVSVPLRPELEIWDPITLHANEAAIPADTKERVLVRIVEEITLSRDRCMSRLTLGAPPD